MRQRTRESGAWSAGINPSSEASYSVIEWEDETGDSEIWEYAQDDTLLRRFVWKRCDATKQATVIELAADGEEVARHTFDSPSRSRGW